MLGAMRLDALDAAIVHHRTPTLLAQALERLATHAPSVPVVVVDTAFDASLPQQLDGVHPAVRWLPIDNHSYSAAVNAAARATQRPLLLQMNADVLIERDTLPRLLATFEDPRVAVAGPLVRTPTGALQDQGLPYRWHQARLRWLHANRGVPSVAAPWLSGCLQVLRRDALAAVGGFDPRLRFYNEDLEWCLRARRAGWRCRLVATPVVHIGGASSTSRVAFALEGLRGGYAVTQRHGRAWQRPLHRAGLTVAAHIAARRATERDVQAAWRSFAQRAAADRLDASCFAERLDEPLC